MTELPVSYQNCPLMGFTGGELFAKFSVKCTKLVSNTCPYPGYNLPGRPSDVEVTLIVPSEMVHNVVPSLLYIIYDIYLSCLK